MRKTRAHKLFRCGLAVVLACGLMVPAPALAAAAEGEGAPASVPEAPPAEAFDAPVSDVAGEAAPDTANDSESTASAEDPAAPGASESDASAGGTASPSVVQAITQAVHEAAAFAAATQPAANGDPAPQSASFTVDGFTITGDTVSASDFEVGANAITVKTDEPFTISGTSSKSLAIAAGTKAHMTFANVSISRTSGAALNIPSGAEAHIILADASTNSFTSTDASWPGIHCGAGAVMTVDDSVPNVDVAGEPITPKNGQIPAGTIYIDNKGEQCASAGDYLTLLDSVEPGKLATEGGSHAAALGGAWGEDGGSMTFNGGIVSATNPDASSGGGAGIGGGRGAAGTSPSDWITINGGRITAQGGYHGAGIGGGYNQSVTLPAGLVQSTHPGGTGNVRVNGGYTESNGGAHGNGFGRACYGSQATCDNRDYTILITGGTMIPNGGKDLAQAMDIGGAGTKPGDGGDTVKEWAANVVISGGSVYVGTKDGRFRFDGTAYGSYTENPDGTITVNKTNQVELITINLAADLQKLEPVNLNRAITTWELLVGGEKVGYGAPAQFDKGNLYLWLTPEQAAQQVTVQLTYADNDGNPVPVDPLYRPAGGGDGGTNLKRYVFFDLQPDFFIDANGSASTGAVAYNALSAYEKEKYGDAVDDNGMVTVPVLKKEYDGKPYVVRALTEDNPINSGGKDKVDIWSDISYLCQLYDAKEHKLGVEVESKAMPSDTGLTRFTMTSTQYANHEDYKESYYGHRAYGWCEITPVKAVVSISENDGTAWVRLDTKTGNYELVQEGDDAKPGDHLRLAFDIRSGKDTAPTCKAPTGSFQVMIDGKPVGDPIPLTKEAIEKAACSTIEVATDGDGREITRVVYYLDPTKLDGALDALGGGSQTNTHEVTIQYQPDKNYVQGTEDNPQNEASKPTTIVPVKPEGDVTPEGPVQIGDSDEPDPGLPDPDNPTGKAKVIRKTITASYGSFHQAGNDALADFFALDLDSSTSSKPIYDVSNAAVATLVPAEEGKPAFGADGAPAVDEKGRLKVQVNSCGTSVITVEQKPNAIYTGIKYILTVNVIPDPGIKPQVQIRLTQRNLTALGEAASSQVVAVAASLFSAAVPQATARAASAGDRALTPPRPGDVVEYTVSGLNLTDGSSWQAGQLIDAIGENLVFNPQSVEIATNYPTPDRDTSLGSTAFYRDFNWDGLDWKDVQSTDYVFNAQTLSKAITPVYGGQSTSVRFTAQVAEGTGERPGADGKPPVVESKPEGSGGWGKDEKDLQPGEEPQPPAGNELEFGKDIIYVGDDDPAHSDPDDPDSPLVPAKPEPVPVLPKDPAAADIHTTVKVDLKDTEVRHEEDRILIGDTLTVTATSENVAPDSKLANAVIKVTLPQGADLLPGTIRLTDAQGNTYKVPDSAYDPATGIVAVNAGDLYGGERASLTFDVEITSTSETRGDGEDQGDPARPGDFPITGGTLGETPTDEWDKEHPDGPDGDRVPAEKPDPGTPFDPGKPWSEVEDEYVVTPPQEDPDMPPVLPRDPKVEGPDADVKVTKEAHNTSRDDGKTRVGDIVRYTVVLANSRQHTMWYDAVFRDVLPRGVDLVEGSIKVTGPDGVERAVPDSAYDEASRTLGVRAGDVAGGRQSVLVFDVRVNEAAVGADIGNVATAYGTRPSDADPTEVSGGSARPAPGDPFSPSEGWDAFARGHAGVSNVEAAYPEGVDTKGGVLPAEGKRLAQTGDGLAAWALGLAAMASGAVVLCAMAARRRFE